MYPNKTKVERKTVRMLSTDWIQYDAVTSSLLIMNGYNIQREFRVFKLPEMQSKRLLQSA